MSETKDFTGNTFGRLTVIKQGKVIKTNRNRNRYYWICQCECGEIKEVRSDCLTSGFIRSCGCFKKEQDKTNLTANHSHKMAGTKPYHLWQAMIQRCHSVNNPNYERWGARGIVVCDEWRNSFQSFYDWIIANGYDGHLTIDRKDNDGPYSPDNCRFADAKTQARNRRSNLHIVYDGKDMTLKELSERTGISYTTLHQRYVAGYELSDLLKPSGALLSSPKGEACHLSKLTEGDVLAIRERGKSGVPRAEIAQEFNIKKCTVYDILGRRTWKHI